MSIFNKCNCVGVCTCKPTNCDLMQLVNEDGYINIVKAGDYIYKINLTTAPSVGNSGSVFANTATTSVSGNGSTASPIRHDVKISAVSGNGLVVQSDGLAVITDNSVAMETANNALQSDTVSLTLSGAFNRSIRADVKISAQPGNAISVFPDGLYKADNIFTQTDARGSITANSPLTYDSSAGILGIQIASGSQAGAVSAADWTIFNNKQSLITWNNVTAGSNKVVVTGTPTGAVKNPFAIDIIEANLSHANIGGVVTVPKGGTGLSAIGSALQVIRVNAGGTALEYAAPSVSAVTSVFGRVGVVVASGGDYNTSQVTENTNLYFTNLRARAAVSATGAISYNSTTGVFSSTVDGSETKLSAGANVTITGVGTIASPYVINSSVAGSGGEHVLTFTTPLQRSVDTISILQAGTAQNGYLSSTDWNFFNNGVFLRSTHAGLRASSGASTTNPYYITDDGQQGFFFYDSVDVTSADNGNGAAGTIIVTADSKRFKRRYDAVLNIRWFGGVDDYAPSGTTMTGTSNTAALNQMMSVALPNQKMRIPTGDWLFATQPNVWDNTKLYNLDIEGNTYHPGVSFIRVQNASNLLHKFVHYGQAIGKLGIPTHTRATYDAGTSPDYTAFAGIFIDVEDSFKSDFTVNFVEGFKTALRVAAGTPGIDLGQENRFNFKWLARNAFGISLESLDGTSAVDKNYFRGGRIGGDVAISFNGNISGGVQTGSFTANVFDNVLIETANSGIVGTGVIKYNSFIGSKIEPSSTTGVLGATKVSFPVTAVGNSFVGMQYLDLGWLSSPGTNTYAYGSPLALSNGTILGGMTLGSTVAGRLTVVGSEGLAASDKALIPANVDYVSLLGSNLITSTPNRFADVKINGIDQTVDYKGKIITITTAGDTILVPPTGYVRISAGSSAVSLVINNTQIYDGSNFIIEQVGTGTISIKRQSDNVVIMATTQITVPGIYYVRYYTTAFTATKLGGSGVTSVLPVGVSPNANGASIIGNAIELEPATLANPGVVTTLAQAFSGVKTFSPTVSAGYLAGTVLNPTINADVNNALGFGLDILGTFNAGAFTGTKYYGLRTPSQMVYAGTGTQATAINASANGLSLSATFTAPTTSFVNYSFSSGYSVKDTYLMIAKSGVTTMGLANDGTDLVFATEKVTNGFIWRKSVGFSTVDFTAAGPTGTNLMKMFPSGNLLIQTGGIYVDNGFKLDVAGAGHFTDQVYVGQLASDPVTNLFNGGIYYNTATNKFRGYVNAAWVDLGSGSVGGGTGDASTNTAVSVVDELPLFADTTGKLFKRATGNGLIRLTAGKVAYGASVNLATEVTGLLALANLNASGTRDSTTFLRGDGQWVVPPAGGAGGGITSAISFGGTANGNGLTISGSTIQMNPASAGQPGGVSTGTQSFAGVKTFTGTIITRASVAGSGGAGTAPIKVTAGALMAIQEPGAVEHVGDSLLFTNSLGNRFKIATSDNNLVFVNKTWHGDEIGELYGGRDATWEDGSCSLVLAPAAGTGAVNLLPASATNARGEIKFTTGTSTSSGIQLTISLSATTIGLVPVISAGNQPSAAQMTNVWVATASNATWTLSCSTALPASTTFSFYYHLRKFSQ